MILDGAGDPYFSTPLSKILTATPPEYVVWKGPGLIVDTPIEDPGQDPSRMWVSEESQPNS